MPNVNPKGNLGEWSELYALGYLLITGGAYSADEAQNLIPELFHSVLEIQVADVGQHGSIQYQINHSNITVLITGNRVAKIEKSLIEAQLKLMLFEIQDGKHSGTFELKSGSQLLETLNKTRISAPSNQTESDLKLILRDPSTGSPTPWIGFSIKSQLGGRSTLLNASGATNFVYKVVNDSDDPSKKYPVFEHGQHSLNLQNLYKAGFRLEFESISNNVFYNNLILLDLQFPKLLAEAITYSYLEGENSFKSVVSALHPHSNEKSRQPIFKFKEFLGAVAMGLRPSILWNGDTTKFSGILVVKNDGLVVFYYLHNRKNFEEYLFENVSFERPSTSRHRYGSIFTDNGIDKIKLNLQIRFNS